MSDSERRCPAVCGRPLDRKLSESVADSILDALAPSPGATARKSVRRSGEELVE
jgi:hypothetical protein